MSLYDPESHPVTSYLKLWGTRGSVPVSGQSHARYGGNTACLEIRRPNELIIIDAGTGIRALGDALLETHFREIHLLIGHAHWDHIIGFPFFQPIYRPDFVIHVYGPSHEGKDIQGALTSILEPQHFPVQLEALKANVVFHELRGGQKLQLGEVEIDTIDCDHPGGALGFALNLPEGKVTYVTDNEFLKGFRGAPHEITLNSPEMAPYLPFVDFVRGSKLLIHEAQYTPRQYASRIGWGHSSISNAVALVNLAGINEWLVTHHDPSALDDTLRERRLLFSQILREEMIDCNVNLAHDGLKLLV